MLFCSDAWGAGKTYAALALSWATPSDQIKCACMFGGYDATMDIDDKVANYVPSVERVLEEFEPLQDENSKNELLSSIVKGCFARFENGYYVSSIKTWIPSFETKESEYDVFVFDSLGNRLTRFEVNNVCFVLFKHKSVGLNVPLNRRIVALVRLQYLAEADASVFTGVPYIRVNESAVPSPRGAIFPKIIENDNGDCSSLKMLQKALATRIVNEFVKADWATSLLNDGKFRAEVNETSNLIGPLFKRLKDIPDENFRNNVENLIAISGGIDVIRDNPTDVIRTTDLIFYPLEEEGRFVVKCMPIQANLFRFGRCFIDSISSMVYDQGGNALPGGLSSGFLNALQQCVESEAIGIYTPHGYSTKGQKKERGTDVLSSYELGGYVNGHIFVTQGSTFLSDEDWYMTTRSRKAKDRSTLYKFVEHTDDGVIVYGFGGYKNVTNDKIYEYKSDEGCYSDNMIHNPNGTKLRSLTPSSGVMYYTSEQTLLQGSLRASTVGKIDMSLFGE